jgi:hypothetical protein
METETSPNGFKEKSKLAFKLKRGIQDIFTGEDLVYHVDKTLGEYQNVKTLLDNNPFLKGELERELQNSFKYHSYEIAGAKGIDYILDPAMVIGQEAGWIGGPGGEGLAKVGSEMIEMPIKGAYALGYLYHTGSLEDVLYFAAWEAAEKLIKFVPVVGQLADLHPTYITTIRSRVRARAVEKFLEKNSIEA